MAQKDYDIDGVATIAEAWGGYNRRLLQQEKDEGDVNAARIAFHSGLLVALLIFRELLESNQIKVTESAAQTIESMDKHCGSFIENI